VNRGLFITFEGIDGCGKSTQVSHAVDFLQKAGHTVIVTREPGGTEISEKIRAVLLSNENRLMVDKCELLLYFAARAQHVAEKIRPALAAGSIVLCDRFAEATIAYQGYGRGFPLDVLDRINAFAADDLVPDMTYIFDCPVACAQERLTASKKAPDRLETNALAFHQRVRQGYLALAKQHPGRIMLVDAGRSITDVSAEISGGIATILARRNQAAGVNDGFRSDDYDI
jgi:dTMP kinase